MNKDKEAGVTPGKYENPFSHKGTERPTGDVEVSYDGGKTWDDHTEWTDTRTCMMAGIAGGNGYFGEGWATSRNGHTDVGLICDPPDFWRRIDEIEQWEKAQLLIDRLEELEQRMLMAENNNHEFEIGIEMLHEEIEQLKHECELKGVAYEAMRDRAFASELTTKQLLASMQRVINMLDVKEELTGFEDKIYDYVSAALKPHDDMIDIENETVNKISDLERENKELREIAGESLLQLEYLSNKFGETGTGNTVITRLQSTLQPPKEKQP